MKQSVNTLPRLPHSPEAETAFLGAILLGNPSTAEEMERLEWTDFFLPFHQVVFRHLKGLRECGKPTNDLVILQESLCDTNELEAAGSMAYVAQLSEGLPRVSNISHYAESIRTKSIVRRQLILIESIREKLTAANGNASDVLREVSILSAPLREDVGQKRILPFKTGEELAEEAQGPIGWLVEGIAAKGAITELGAKVKVGKTTLVLAMVEAIVDGKAFLNLPTFKTAVVYLTEQPATSFRQAMERANLLGRKDFTVLPYSSTRGRSWPEVASAAIEECKRAGAGLLIVDTLSQFAGLTGDRENNSGDALEAMGPLQKAAAEGIGIIVVRHERKSGGDVGDSGRGSSAFAGAVDIVLSLRRAEGNAPKTRRRLQSLSRFLDPPDLLIEMTASGYVALGKPHETAAKDAENSVLEIAPQSEVQAMNLKDLAIDAGVSRQTAQRAVDELIREGMLAIIGKGKRGDAFRYFVPENHFCPTSNTEVAEKETNQNGWRGDTSAEQDPD
jgi:hypothetical protein